MTLCFWLVSTWVPLKHPRIAGSRICQFEVKEELFLWIYSVIIIVRRDKIIQEEHEKYEE